MSWLGAFLTSPGLQAAHSALACSRPGPADVPDASEEERFILYSPRGFYILLPDIRCLALIAVLYTQIPFGDQTSSFKPKWKYFRRQTHYLKIYVFITAILARESLRLRCLSQSQAACHLCSHPSFCSSATACGHITSSRKSSRVLPILVYVACRLLFKVPL